MQLAPQVAIQYLDLYGHLVHSFLRGRYCYQQPRFADKQSGPLCPHMLHSFRDEQQTQSPLGALRPLPACSWGGGGASEVVPAKSWGEVKGGSKLMERVPPSPEEAQPGAGRGGAQRPGVKHSACVYCASAFFSPWYPRLQAGDDSVPSILESRNIS